MALIKAPKSIPLKDLFQAPNDFAKELGMEYTLGDPLENAIKDLAYLELAFAKKQITRAKYEQEKPRLEHQKKKAERMAKYRAKMRREDFAKKQVEFEKQLAEVVNRYKTQKLVG